MKLILASTCRIETGPNFSIKAEQQISLPQRPSPPHIFA